MGHRRRQPTLPFTGLIVPAISSTSYTTAGWQIRGKARRKHRRMHAPLRKWISSRMHVPLFKAYWGNALIVFKTNTFTRVEPLMATQHPPTNEHAHSLPLSWLQLWSHPSHFLCKLISCFRGLLFLKEFLVASYTPIHHLSIAESRGHSIQKIHFNFKEQHPKWCVVTSV